MECATSYSRKNWRACCGCLGEAGIPVIPLKGVALAELLYGDLGARVCADIDILVPANDAVRARRIILMNGYSSQFTEQFFARHQLHTTSEASLVSEDGRPHLPGRTSLDALAQFLQRSGGHGQIYGPILSPASFLEPSA